MTNRLEQNYPQFFELNGIALNDGYIYIGVDGLIQQLIQNKCI